MPKKMKFLSLFAGIGQGGFDLGLERAGFECAGQVEINPFCQKVLAKHWPNVKREGDIRNVTSETFGAIDLICGGFPCQPFSAAGKRKGKDDDRYLWPEMLRVIEAYKPSYVIGENVTGILNLAFDQVCSDLESQGYEVQTLVIPACSLNAPHKRDRVWFLAYSNSIGNGRAASPLAQAETKPEEQVNGLFANSESKNGSSVPNTNSEGLQRSKNGREFDSFRKNETEQSLRLSCSTWEMFPTQPALCGRDDGVSNRVDRIKALGNAVVPQIVEIIGKAIKAGALHYSLQQSHGVQSVSQPAPNCEDATSPC